LSATDYGTSVSDRMRKAAAEWRTLDSHAKLQYKLAAATLPRPTLEGMSDAERRSNVAHQLAVLTSCVRMLNLNLNVKTLFVTKLRLDTNYSLF